MNCPLCNVALKAVSYRSVEVNYCPLCGGTWLDRLALDNVSQAAVKSLSFPLRLLRIAILTALILAGCLIATVAVGAIKLWPTIRSWTESLLSGKDTAVTAHLPNSAGLLSEPRVLQQSPKRFGPHRDIHPISNSGFERLLNSVTAVPSLGPMVQNGTYHNVLLQAARQRVENLEDPKIDEIGSPHVRHLPRRFKGALQRTPGGGGVAGTVDPAVPRAGKQLAPGQAYTVSNFGRRACACLSRRNAVSGLRIYGAYGSPAFQHP